MIKIGDNPESDPEINKFIAINGEGHRGRVVAMHKTCLRAIVLAMNTSFNSRGGVKWGRMYLVEEDTPKEYPKVVRRVTEVPISDEWKIVV